MIHGKFRIFVTSNAIVVMKRIVLCFSLLWVMYSCSDYRNSRAALDLAESLIGEAPDSSLAILQRMDALALPTRGLYARYVLSLTMARDKCYMDVSQDTTIRMAYEWYKHYGSKKDRMLSAYYLGVVKQQADNHIEAILAFREAEPLAEALEDYRQLSLIGQHLSEIYYINHDVREEPCIMRKNH